MITQRIDALNIQKRGLFTAIYGVNRTDEVYITADTKVYTLHEALYLYLCEQGYITVFFDDKVFSYDEGQLLRFFEFEPQRQTSSGTATSPTTPTLSSGRRDFFRNKGPMANSRAQSFETPPFVQSNSETGQTHHDAVHFVENNLKRHYEVLQTEGLFTVLNRIVERDAQRKVAVVFINPNTVIFDENQQCVYENYLSLIRANYVARNIGLKIIALYDFQSHESFSKEFENGTDKFFFRPPFKDLILNDLNDTNNHGDALNSTVFFLSDPGRDEAENMLQRKRFLEDMEFDFGTLSWDRVVTNIWQGITLKKNQKDSSTLRLMRDYLRLSADELGKLIRRMSTEKAIDRLKHMQGIENVRRQFELYRKSYRAHKRGDGGGRFRPHMALMGSPGTGKTTVARLFGDILREEGLLSKGHFVKVDVSELIGEYVGSTRPKTKAVCERAKGGVLFIDEAYGLMSGDNSHGDVNYGAEAIEVLIQFMEDNDDSLVVLAGYTDEINHLINEGNKGFRRRFNELGFFHFNDYEPDVLYNIALGMIPVPTTEAFRTALRNIIIFKYTYRTKKFGNVGDMENLVNNMVGTYREAIEHEDLSNGQPPLDIVHLSEKLKLLVDPTMLNADMILAELNALVGQEGIKTIIRNLFAKCRSERIKLSLFSAENCNPGQQVLQPEMPRLYFVFSGNPGTGKTTIARIMGTVLQRMGVLSSNDGSVMTEIAGNDLLTATPATIKKLFEDNIGKVLFIDEAYQLRESPRVVADIVGNTTNKDYQNKLCLILAGYSNDMQSMMDVNSGIRRRFQVIEFADYTDDELWEIMRRMADNPSTQVRMDQHTCRQPAMEYFSSLTRDANFGNAGVVDNLMEMLKANRDNRYNEAAPEQQRNIDFALRILPEDFPRTAGNRQGDNSQEQEPLLGISTEVQRPSVRNSLQEPAVYDGVIDLSGEDKTRMVSRGEDLYVSVGLLEEENTGATGTAFIISLLHNYIVTASHVIEGFSHFSFTLHTQSRIMRSNARLLWNNPQTDFALLQVDDLPNNARYFGFDLDSPRQPGTKIQIGAFPKGVRFSHSMFLTQGVIGNYEPHCHVTNENGVTRVFDVIRTEAQATHGSSGGPVMMVDTMRIIGVLHGGMHEDGFSVNAVTDIAQLFSDNTINIQI